MLSIETQWKGLNMQPTVSVTLVISCKIYPNIENETQDWDESILVHVSDFIFVPSGTKVTLYDDDECLFEDRPILEVHINNRHGGLLIEIDVEKNSFEKMLVLSKACIGSYSRFIYPRTLSLFNNSRKEITSL